MSNYLLTGLTLCIAGSAHAQNKAPNILFIMSDDHATQAISSYGGFLGQYLPTPNIDRIGNEGARLDRFYVTNSISTPSRACFLTGQYSQKNGVYTLSYSLDRNHPNVAKELQNEGYQTAVVGKWHLGTEPAGFDYYNVLPGQGRYYNPLMIGTGDWNRGPNGNPKQTEFGGHSTDVITNEAIRFMQSRDPERPFFLKCNFKAPHRPWEPAHRFFELFNDIDIAEPENLFDNYDGKGQYAQLLTMSMEHMNLADLKGIPFPEGMTRDEKRRWAYQRYIKDYLRCVAGIDENIGRILKYLDENGLAENTIIVYTSDQGFFLGEHGWFDKRLIYEEAIRTPMLIRYPNQIPSGTVIDDFVLNIDLAPLFLDYVGLPIPSYMQGESFRNNLIGQTPSNWRKSIYYRYWQNNDFPHSVPAHYGIRTERYKLVYYYSLPLGKRGARENSLLPEWELYDLLNDPAEMHNIYNDPANKDLITQLKNELLLLKEKYDDQDSKYPEMVEINKEYF